MGADPDAREYVIKSLRSRGASLFVPVVGADDVDLAVRGADGQYVEVRVMSPEPDAPGWFRVRRFRPKAYVFFVCVGSPSGASPEAWVFPSGIFERFASRRAVWRRAARSTSTRRRTSPCASD